MDCRGTENLRGKFISEESHLLPYLSPTFLSYYMDKKEFDLLTQISQIIQLKKSDSKVHKTTLVSLQIERNSAFNSTLHLSHLLSKKKCLKAKELMNLLIPSSASRINLQNIRDQLVARAHKGLELPQEQLGLILELYFLLNLERKNIDEEINKYLLGEHSKELKTILTSVKKMIGNQLHLEEEQKKGKQNAYFMNIEIRQILSYCSGIIQQPSVKIKLNSLLSIPKNKKWLGARLHRILLENDWNKEDMMILVQAIQKSIKEKDPLIKKQLRNTKKILNQAIRNITKMVNEGVKSEPTLSIAEKNQLPIAINAQQEFSLLFEFTERKENGTCLKMKKIQMEMEEEEMARENFLWRSTE